MWLHFTWITSFRVLSPNTVTLWGTRLRISTYKGGGDGHHSASNTTALRVNPRLCPWPGWRSVVCSSRFTLYSASPRPLSLEADLMEHALWLPGGPGKPKGPVGDLEGGRWVSLRHLPQPSLLPVTSGWLHHSTEKPQLLAGSPLHTVNSSVPVPAPSSFGH